MKQCRLTFGKNTPLSASPWLARNLRPIPAFPQVGEADWELQLCVGNTDATGRDLRYGEELYAEDLEQSEVGLSGMLRLTKNY